MTNVIAVNSSGQIKLSDNDRLYVPRDVGVLVAGSTAITSQVGANGHEVTVEGAVASLAGYGIALGQDTGGLGDHRLMIGATGSVHSLSDGYVAGVILYGSDNRLLNRGEITGTLGAYLQDATDAVVENHGFIGGLEGVGLFLLFATGAQVVNTGLISGTSGVQFDFSAGRIENSGEIVATGASGRAIWASSPGGSLVVVNSGHLSAPEVAILAGGFADRVVNTGHIDGDISLGGGADLYRGSGTVEGQVLGGAGGDTLLGGAGNETLSGEGDDDRIEGRGGDDRLDGGTGPDDLRGGAGDDVVTGGNGGDTLRGGAGEDELSGDAGADVLNGGRDDDILTGGGGPDIFVFIRKAGDDVITDFQNGQDLIDLTAFGLKPADYAGVVAPALSDAGNGATFLDLAALGGSGSVRIEGLAFASANAADFVL